MPEQVQHGAHVFPFRVYYEDTDAAGIVYYANYLKFEERARSELLRDLGTDNTALLERHGVMFAVHDVSVTYHQPARLDDALEVHTQIQNVGGATLSAQQRVTRSGKLLADLEIRLACINATGRPVRLPAVLRTAFQTLHKRH